jgi:hypothetical protein
MKGWKMRYCQRINYAKSAIVVLTLVLYFTVSAVSVAAAESSIVNLSVSAQPISAGSQFTVGIMIQPNNNIAGVQFQLIFNPSLVTINSVSEGNLLKQQGATTYFNPGQINNSAGIVTGVAGVITEPGKTVSNPGTLAIITMTAGQVPGTCPLTLSKLILGDTNAHSIPVTVNSGQVEIVTPTSPTPPISSGGGGANGGISIPPETPQTVETPPTSDTANLPLAATPIENEQADNTPALNNPDTILTSIQDTAFPEEISPLLTNDSTVSSNENQTSLISETPVQGGNEQTFRLSLFIEMLGGSLLVFGATAGLILFLSRKRQRENR